MSTAPLLVENCLLGEDRPLHPEPEQLQRRKDQNAKKKLSHAVSGTVLGSQSYYDGGKALFISKLAIFVCIYFHRSLHY